MRAGAFSSVAHRWPSGVFVMFRDGRRPSYRAGAVAARPIGTYRSQRKAKLSAIIFSSIIERGLIMQRGMSDAALLFRVSQKPANAWPKSR